MAKLPVLYAPLFGGKLDTNDDEVELARLFVRKADALVEHGPDFAEYIPARRCRTCAKFLQEPDDFDGGTTQRFCTRSHLLVEPDEYCSRHEPREGHGDAKG